MFLENRFERTMDRVRACAAIPARIELWNGRSYDLSAEPTVTIGIPRPSALRYFISPNLNSLGLDIGCGRGTLILRATREYGAVATGITLSQNQFEYARERIRAEGLQDRCSVQLTDYRDLPNGAAFDKITSVGMFEHVGLKHLPEYFAKLHALLKDGGLALNHGITTSDVNSGWMGLGAGEFIDRYVFPEGELPHLSLVLKEMAAAGFEVTDAESLRRHYARTCHAWASALTSNYDRAVKVLQEASEKRVRIWQIYLAGCAYGFAHGWMNVYQLLACKAGIAGEYPLPLTRDYMYESRTEV